MRTISTILNIALIIAVIVIVADDGWPRELYEQLMISLFFITPIVSLLALIGYRGGSSENWISLYFQRKRLEEKSKINKLKDNAK